MVILKSCPTCKQDLPLDAFYKNHRKPDGLENKCKQCLAEYSKAFRAANKAKIAQNKKDWYAANKDKITSYNASYYEVNKEKIVNRVVAYRTKRLKTDPIFKLQKNLRQRVGKLLKQKSSSVAVKYLGCSLDDLKVHLESKFTDGMTWDNYGKWHVDHIRPLAAFDLTNDEECKAACRYTNLQPLWAADNLKKGIK